MPNNIKKSAIGIDIGGTNTAIGIVDQTGKVLTKTSIPTPGHGNINRFITDLSASIRSEIKKIETSQTDIIGIGIGAPNSNYYTGTIEQAPNLSFKGVVPFVKLLGNELKTFDNITLTNDANAAALGEKVYGGAKNMKNFVMYTLGTGVGSGVIVNGKLVYGRDGFAGECGHTTLVPNGRLCGCGAKGHLEAYCSATGMKRTALELLAQYNDTASILADYSLNSLNSKIIFEAAQKGDRLAVEVFELTGHWLGQGLADTVHHLSPEAIFLFGGPVAAGDLILKPTKESMEKHLLPVFRNKVQVLPSLLKPGDAAIVGASALVWNKYDL